MDRKKFSFEICPVIRYIAVLVKYVIKMADGVLLDNGTKKLEEFAGFHMQN